MSLTILNSISALSAENSLTNTQANLQKTLTQLSTGLRINTGADDSAGLSIANGLQANIAALTQSQQNASNGIGLLQTADGALSQVTTLLNRAVTLATEASSSGLGSTQSAALNTEFQSILTEITQIGNATNFNGQNVFAPAGSTSFTSTQAGLSSTTALTAGDTVTIADSKTGGTFVFTAGSSSTINDLATAVTNAVSAGTLSAGTTASVNGAGKLVIGPDTAANPINVTSNDSVLGPLKGNLAASSTNTVYIGDGTTVGASNTTISTTISALSATVLGLNTSDLSSTTDAQTALAAINSAITSVAAQRGQIGASVNRLDAANNVISNQVQNLQSADNSIQNADIGKTVANLTQYNILQSTGLSALQQSNQASQAVLKLLQ